MCERTDCEQNIISHRKNESGIGKEIASNINLRDSNDSDDYLDPEISDSDLIAITIDCERDNLSEEENKKSTANRSETQKEILSLLSNLNLNNSNDSDDYFDSDVSDSDLIELFDKLDVENSKPIDVDDEETLEILREMLKT